MFKDMNGSIKIYSGNCFNNMNNWDRKVRHGSLREIWTEPPSMCDGNTLSKIIMAYIDLRQNQVVLSYRQYRVSDSTCFVKISIYL